MFFVIGNPRSGTTLFRLMLNNHPEIAIPPECGFALWWYKKYQYADFSRADMLKCFLQDLLSTKKIETWQLDANKLESFLKEKNPQSYREVVDLVYIHYVRKTGDQAQIIGDKNNFYLNYIPEIKELFPDSRFLFIIRDGRDVACSYRDLANRKIQSKYAPKLPVSIEEIAREWVDNNTIIEHELAENFMLIRYEDLLLKTVETLKKVCAYLGVEYHPDMLDYYVNNLRHRQEPADFLQWKEKTLQPPDINNVEKYMRILSRQEIELFEQIAGDALEHFGYSIGNGDYSPVR